MIDRATERVGLVAAAIRVSEFKAGLVTLLGNTETAGQVYLQLSNCLDIITKRISTIDRKALEGAIENWR